MVKLVNFKRCQEPEQLWLFLQHKKNVTVTEKLGSDLPWFIPRCDCTKNCRAKWNLLETVMGIVVNFWRDGSEGFSWNLNSKQTSVETKSVRPKYVVSLASNTSLLLHGFPHTLFIVGRTVLCHGVNFFCVIWNLTAFCGSVAFNVFCWRVNAAVHCRILFAALIFYICHNRVFRCMSIASSDAVYSWASIFFRNCFPSRPILFHTLLPFPIAFPPPSLSSSFSLAFPP